MCLYACLSLNPNALNLRDREQIVVRERFTSTSFQPFLMSGKNTNVIWAFVVENATPVRNG